MLIIDDRQSNSSLVDAVWRSHSAGAGSFLSIASTHLELVVTKHANAIQLDFRGPETRPTPASYPSDVEWLGIQFKAGVFLPHFPTAGLVDGGMALPQAGDRTFWLRGSAWQYPDFENIEEFVAKLVREGLLVRDAAVEAVLDNRLVDLTPRTLQRRFLHATGLTHGALAQIERARDATRLLRRGTPILDVVDRLGYSDQPHLTRSLKRFIGQTPAKLLPNGLATPLSYLNESSSSGGDPG